MTKQLGVGEQPEIGRPGHVPVKQGQIGLNAERDGMRPAAFNAEETSGVGRLLPLTFAIWYPLLFDSANLPVRERRNPALRLGRFASEKFKNSSAYAYPGTMEYR